MSLVLTSDEVMQVLNMDLALAAAREAFRAYGEGRVNMPPKSYLTLAKGDFRAMYGEIFLESGHVCGLKWVNVHPENPKRGLLTVMAKIVLNDPETGLEWADMDGTYITNYRTGAAGGVAAEVLSRPDSKRLGVIGAGEHPRTQIAAVLQVRPIEEVIILRLRPSAGPSPAGGSGSEISGQNPPGTHPAGNRPGCGHPGHPHPQQPTPGCAGLGEADANKP